MKIGQIINGIAVVAVSAAAFLVTFALFSGGEVEDDSGWIMTGNMVFDEVVEVVSSPVTARLNGRDTIALMPGSVAQLSWDEDERHVDVQLSSGSVVYATIAGDFSASIVTDFARVDSQNSIAYVDLSDDGSDLNIYATQHPSLVTFTSDGSDLNSISVPTEYRMKVPSSKISSTIGKLRLTKLSKEFPVYLLEDDDLSGDVWEEIDEIDFVYTESMTEFTGDILARSQYGPPTEGFVGGVNSFYENFRAAFTVLDHAKDRLDEETKGNLLIYTLTNLLYGDESDGLAWLAQWEESEYEPEEVADLYAEMFFVLPGDIIYPVKEDLAAVLYAGEDTLTLLRLKFLEIESLLSKGEKVLAEEAYDEYKNEFQSAMANGVFDDESWLDDISREYSLLELLLRSHSTFYNTDSVSLLTDLEEKILFLAGSDQDLDEERQSFVQSKIRYLENLFSFVVSKKISVVDATDLAEDLIFSAETYLNAVSSATAVQSYFEGKLDDFDLAVQFMNSPEFYSYSDFDEGLEAYRVKVDDIDELNEYIQSLRSGASDEDASIDIADAYAEVYEDLLLAGVTYSDLVWLEDSGSRLFEIQNGSVGGYSFDANYDRETQLLYDLVVEDVRFSTGLLLENVRDVIETALEEDTGDVSIDLDGVIEDTVASGGSSLAESVAKSEAKDSFSAAGLDTTDFTLTLVDLDASLFTFEGVITRYELPVSGTYDLISNQVSEVVWEFNGSAQSMPDLDLNSLESAIETTATALTTAGL